MSKTFSLAGLRLGWIAGPKALLEQVSRHRDYSTISCGMIDEYLAGIALAPRRAVIARNRRHCHRKSCRFGAVAERTA